MVVICHGLTGNRVGPMRLLTVLAEELAMLGFLCLRFDFRGSGDSSGDFSATTFASMCSDLEQVTSWGRQQFGEPPLALVGLSIGGVPPALMAGTLSPVAVVLLSSDLIEDIYFPNVEGMVPVRGGEFELPEAFWREREGLHPFSDLRRTGVPSKLFYGSLDSDLAEAAPRFKAAGFAVEKVKGVGHLFEDVEVRRHVGRRVGMFLRQSVRRLGEQEGTVTQ
jgi:pimeloyl-ACP methyl ester carboxylesterase